VDEAKRTAMELSTALAMRSEVKKIQQSLLYLEKQASFIECYDDLDHFAFGAFQDDRSRAHSIEYHLCQLRTVVMRELWERQLFLSLNTIEQLLYLSLRKSPANPLQTFIQVLFDNGLHHPGFVLYPLHSFGFLAAGLFSSFKRRSQPRIDLSSAGIALTPQTNSLDRSAAFLNDTRKKFGISHKIPDGLLDHFYRSRDLRWYTHNPLLAVKVSSYTSGYYENQRILELKLRLSATLVAMMSVMGRREDPERAQAFSTRRTNNWQTLDIRHYLLFQVAPRKLELSVDCTPMHLNQVEMAEISDLGTDIDPRAWTADKRDQLQWIRASLSALEAAFLRHCVIGSKDEVARRLYRKLLTSLGYFRRSLRARTYELENVVALAIAFETLLTDFYSKGGTKVLIDRARACLKGVRGVNQMRASVEELFSARGAIVHVGSAEVPASIWLSRRTYVMCFKEVIGRLEGHGKLPENPIAVLFP
jgi:hypothetical protein